MKKFFPWPKPGGVSLEQMVEEWVEIGAAATEFAIFKKKGTH